jgi:cysteine desulfuration protein SufE
MTLALNDIQSDFAVLEDWEDRYRYLIDLGRELPPYPEEARNEAHKVEGCVSQVWLLVEREEGDDPVLHFTGDSDAHIVRGLVAVLLALFSGRRASEILTLDAEAVLQSLGLDQHLTAQRSNGLRAMVKRIRAEAQAALTRH